MVGTKALLRKNEFVEDMAFQKYLHQYSQGGSFLILYSENKNKKNCTLTPYQNMTIFSTLEDIKMTSQTVHINFDGPENFSIQKVMKIYF